MSESKIILLVTSMPASSVIEGNQNFCRQVFRGKKIGPVVELDGMNPNEKEERNILFAISEKRGLYPQIFIKINDEISFVGDFEKMNELNDCNSLPPEILSANPQIQTFDKVFAFFLNS
uniref:Glutaredoxin domain-containing protein n=1 Tax=Aureoumbra lagunensis TaxID=44058 RepID=A0A7S3K396_9STRA|mmetsp:Transcript_9465/g.13099  ORF Transcript_9465/g.13099 Transcript_9465/m.13099 type:complete len:119 (+) Transcript_9465:37-393(+)